MATPTGSGLIGWLAVNRQLSGRILYAVAALFAALPIYLLWKHGSQQLPTAFWGGFLAMLSLVGGVFQTSRHSGDDESEHLLARLVVVALGGAAGVATAVYGLGLAFQFQEAVVAVVRDGKREDGWKVFVALLALLSGLAIAFVSLQKAVVEQRRSVVLRRLVYGFNAFLTGFLLLAILVVINVLVTLKVPSVIDATYRGMYSISDASIRVLDDLNQSSRPVTVYLVLSSASQIYDEVRTLLTNCQERLRGMKVEVIAPSNARRIRELMKKYPALDEDSQGMLVVVGEGNDEVSTFIRGRDLIGRDGGGMTGDPGDQKIKFEGEVKLLSELKFLADGKRKPVIYFTQGHGELDLNNMENRVKGIGQLKTRLDRRNFDARPLKFEPLQPNIPDDANVVVVAGSDKPWPPAEVDALRKYADRGGKLVVMIGVPNNSAEWAQTGLENLLVDYGVRIESEVIFGIVQNLQGEIDPVAVIAGISPAAQAPELRKVHGNSPVQMRMPRVVRTDPASRHPNTSASALMETVVDGWTESNLKIDPMQTLNGFLRDPQQRKRISRDPIPVAAAVTESAPPTAASQTPTNRPRLIAVGDATWVSNPFMVTANGDVFIAMLDWLRERPANIGIPPREYDNFLLQPTASGWRMLVLPGVLALAGVVGLGTGVWLVRRQ